LMMILWLFYMHVRCWLLPLPIIDCHF
jgi:hypothetical protein